MAPRRRKSSGRKDEATLEESYGGRVVEALNDLIGYCAEAELVVALGRDRFMSDVLIQRAAEAILNRIGDTIRNRLPPPFLDEYDGQPWAEIVGQRVMIAHHDMRLDYNLLWRTLTERVPPLRDYVADDVLGA